MANLVTYGNFDFSSISEGIDPFVGVSDEQVIVGGKFKTLKRITIQGKILPTNFCSNSQNVSSKINILFEALKNDFQSITAGDISGQFARCESVDVNQSSFFGEADYTANFICYPDDLSNINYRIINPVDNRQITENADGTIVITRQISAQGLGPDAINNARNFINNGITPQKNIVPPILFVIGNLTDPGSNLKPRRMTETVNRMEGTVSLDVEFIYRSNAPNNNIILSNSIDINYDEKSGLYTVNIQGNLITSDISDINNNSDQIQTQLKSSLQSINLFNLAFTRFKEFTGLNYLNPEPENFSITEDRINNSLNFNYTFTNDPYDVKSDISYQMNYDRIKDITTIIINGTLTARGPQKDKKTKLESAYESLNLFNLASNFFNRNAESRTLNLNSNPINSNVTYNQYEDTVISLSFSTEYSNQFEEVPGLKRFEYTLSATPSIDVYYPIQFLDGNNGVFNLNFFKRGSVAIDGSALGESSSLGGSIRNRAIDKLKDLKSNVGSVSISVVTTEDNVATPIYSDDGFNYDFNISENCETRKYE
jgi:hypothetical protein